MITGLEPGGAEQQLALLLRHTRQSAEVVSLTGLGSIGRQLLADGVPVHTLRMRGNRDLGAVWRLAALMRRGAFDVVHVHLYRACIYGRIAARLAGVPTVVTTEHSLGDTHLEGRPINRSIRALYLATARLSRITIAVSPKVEQRLIDWGLERDRIVIIPNGLDVAAMRFDPAARDAARREFGIAPGTTVIGSVGRLHPVKGFDALIAGAAPHLRDGAQLLLVGTGPERQRLEERARSVGVTDRLSLAGERSDVARLLAAMDVYAAPSREETFGLAVLEALAAGLPAVVGQCPALDGLDLPQVERMAVTDDSTEALSAALSRAAGRAVADPAGRAPPQVLLDHFGIHAVARQIDALYERLGTNVTAETSSPGGATSDER